MVRNDNNFDCLHDIVEDLSFLDYDEDYEFLEWYSIEGSEKISELSRQLRSFFSYKSAVIRYRFSGFQDSDNILKKDSIVKKESELFSLSSQYIEMLERIGLENKTVKEKILILIERVKTQPHEFERNLLKDIKQLGSEIWKIFHIISELEIHLHPRSLHVALKIANILCSAEDAFFWPFSCFYEALKSNYKQLEKELSGILQINKIKQNKTNIKRKKERILE